MAEFGRPGILGQGGTPAPRLRGTKESSLTYWDRAHIFRDVCAKSKENESLERSTNIRIRRFGDKLEKGVWGMPRLSEAKKDVISCEKPRGSAHTI